MLLARRRSLVLSHRPTQISRHDCAPRHTLTTPRRYATTTYHFTRAPRYFVGPYLVVITGRAEIGCIYQHSVWEVKRAMCVPFARNRRHLSAAQLRIEDRYIQMIQSVFDTTVMYFSYSYVLPSLIASKARSTPCACEVRIVQGRYARVEAEFFHSMDCQFGWLYNWLHAWNFFFTKHRYDLTHGLQRLHTSGESFYQEPLHKRMDRRFCWNHHLLDRLARSGAMSQYMLPIVAGFVRILGRVDVNGHSVEVTDGRCISNHTLLHRVRVSVCACVFLCV
jgi:hypothetical protein